MIVNMHEHYKAIQDYNIELIYNGPIWSEEVEGLAECLRRRISIENLPLSTAQCIFSVFVEQINNILMYSAEKTCFKTRNDDDFFVSKGMFVLGTSGNTCFMQSGNLIQSENAEFIESRIKYLNTLDKKDLRKYYKEQIKAENTNKESKGGGIGLIEIARRASSKIEYSFQPYENGLSFFSMFVTIEK